MIIYFQLPYSRKHYRRQRRPAFKESEIQKARTKSQFSKVHKGHKKAEEAELFLQQGNLKQAKKLAVQAIRNSVARKSVMPWIVLAKVRKAERRRSDAIENLQIASRLHKTTPDVYTLMADYYTEFNQLHAAQKTIQKGIVKHGDNGLFYYQKAVIDLKLGDISSYKAHIKQCKKHPRKIQKGKCLQFEAANKDKVKKKEKPKLNINDLLRLIS